MLSRRVLIRVVALAPLIPVLIGLEQEVAHPERSALPRGDIAVLEMHLRGVSRFEHWLGPYSRFGWNHPGPFYYFSLLPLYWLSGASTSSLYASAALITLFASAASIALFFRARPAPGDRALFVLTFSAFALQLFAERLPSNPWNPVVTVMPFALLWVLCLRIATSEVALLPAAVLVHAFVVQTHISYLPCASVLLVVALALSLHERRNIERPVQPGLRRAVGLSLLGFVLVWLPPVLAEFGTGKSNFAAIVRHFTSGQVPPNSLGFMLGYGATQLQDVPLRAVGLDGRGHDGVALGLAALQFVGLCAGFWVAGIRKDRLARASCVLGVAATLVCFWSCRYLGDVADQHDYLTLWFALIGMFDWLAVGLALRPAAPEDHRATTPSLLFIGLAALLVGALTVLDTRTMLGRYRRPRAGLDAARVALSAEAARVEVLLRHAKTDYVLGVAEGRPWDILAGIALELDKRGLRPIIDERWRFMFGSGQRYGHRSSMPALAFSKRPLHAARLSDSFGPKSFLYIESPLTQGAARSSVSATGAVGDPRWVVDGWLPLAGAAWNSPCVLQLEDEASSVSLHLPGLRVPMLDAVLDANDGYVIEASEDGRAFTEVATIQPSAEGGLRRRQVTLATPGPWRELRVSPRGGDRHYAVGELRVDGRAWGVNLIASSGVRGDARLVVDGNAPREGTRWTAKGAVQLERGASLTFRLPDMLEQDSRVEGLRVSADGNDEYEISGSYDGTSFNSIGTLPARSGRGIRTRNFFFNDGRDWSVVRIAPLGGDGRFSVAEVSPIVTAGRLIDLARPGRSIPELREGWARPPGIADAVVTTGARARLRLVMPAGLDHRLGLALARVGGARVRVILRMDGDTVAELALGDGMLVYTVELPGSSIRAENEVELEVTGKFVGRTPPSVRLSSFWFGPSPGVQVLPAGAEDSTSCR